MEAFRTVLELIYFASGPLLVIIAGFGLRQLKIVKDASRLQATREALSLSAERCDHYVSHVIPLINKLDLAINKNDIKYFSMFKVIIDRDKIRITHNCSKEVLIQELTKTKTIYPQICAALNAMEAFSVFFTSRVADESVAFSSVGGTFCNSVHNYLAFIMTISGLDAHFKNLLKLFLLWNARIEANKLEQDRQKIDKELSKFENNFIRPIGTE